MSFDEIGAILKENSKKDREQWERARIGWYYSLIAPGMSKVQAPEDLLKFSWERKSELEVKGKKYTKEELRQKEIEAQKWLNK